MDEKADDSVEEPQPFVDLFGVVDENYEMLVKRWTQLRQPRTQIIETIENFFSGGEQTCLGSRFAA